MSTSLIDAIDDMQRKSIVETVSYIKIRRHLEPDFAAEPQQYSQIQDMIGVYELAIVELWRYAFSTQNAKQKNEFHKMCNDCFSLLQVLPIPDDPVEKIKHILKLLTYAYLGEKWEDMRRFILENDTTIPDYDGKDWDLRLFSTIYTAIISMVQKTSRDDLEKSARHITKLRSEQENSKKSFSWE